MSKFDIQRPFSDFEAFSIGFSPVFRDFQAPTSNYPPHNIISLGEDEIILELAVAGFKKDEVTISEHRGLVTIIGKKYKEEIPTVYITRGIAARDFERKFRVAEFFEIKEAKFEDGILSIRFVKNVPDEEKPKTIKIK